MVRGIAIKVAEGAENIMETYKLASETKKYVWYCYFGNPVTKPYGKGYGNAFFIGDGKLYHTHFKEIRAGIMHEGGKLNENEIDFLPKEYQNNIELQDEIAFFMKCGVIRELDYDKALECMFYEKTGKPYFPLEVRTAVCYVDFKCGLDDLII
ncbi:MAG: hypothetical protein KAT05_06540 [Spirochaetes bacterium]|nr:hypothetical protein [Spirochaetota bacterium]